MLGGFIMKKNLVLVDDDKVLLQLIGEELGFHFKVTSFYSSSEAYSYIKNNKDNIDILLTDYKMPEMNGLELISKATIIKPQIYRILITGYYELIEGNPGLENCNLVIEKQLMKKISVLAEKINNLVK